MDRNRTSSRRKKQRQRVQTILFGGVLSLFLLFCVVVGGGLGLVVAFYGDLPSLAPLEDYNSGKWNLPTKVYGRDGTLIAQFYEERREIVDIENLPPELIEAVIAIEDNRFFQHSGVDFRGIARAAYKNLMAGRIVEGGSTITQQLAKVLFLNSRQTFRRKMKEALLALKIERNYTKREILDRYFNKIYFGAGAYGVEAASKVYFDTSARYLNTAQSALLAALPKAPSYYSPFNNPEEARERHRLVLEMMVEQGMITVEEAQRGYRQFWKNFEDQINQSGSRHRTQVREAPYFVEHVRQELLDRYGADVVYRGGLKVHTTVNLNYQDTLQKELNKYLLEFNKMKGNVADTASTIPRTPRGDLIEGAVFLKDPQNGEVLAVVGGHQWHVGNQLNRALQSHRQPGSAFKPVLYTAALDQGYSMSTRLQDRPLIYETPQGDWVPKNYSKVYHGEVTLRTALVNSLNVATVDLMEQIGPETVIQYARKMGIRSSLSPHMSLALGGLHGGVTLAEMTDVYSVFANKGVKTSSIYIREVRDREGNLLERNFPYKQEVLSPQVSFIMTSLLQNVVEEGTGQVVGSHFQRPIAGKTGTTNQFRDAWFMGFTPDLVMGSWFGYDSSNRSMGDNMTGGFVAGRFWRRAAKKIMEGRPPRSFSVPPGIHFISIDPTTGYRATPQCPRTSREPFMTGSEPTRRCPVHGNGKWS